MRHTSDQLHNLHLDFETSGLDEFLHDIIDVGVIGTTADHRILFTYSSLVHASPLTLAAIAGNADVSAMMQRNGLLERLIDGSTNGTLLSLAEVEDELLAILDDAGITAETKVTLAGSGVATFDMRFIRASMPRLHQRLNYWTADVGVIRREWKESTGTDLVTINKDKPHTGIDDARIHLNEAIAYRAVFTRLARLAGGGDLESIEAFLDKAGREVLADRW